jgi:hypothetical protein
MASRKLHITITVDDSEKYYSYAALEGWAKRAAGPLAEFAVGFATRRNLKGTADRGCKTNFSDKGVKLEWKVEEAPNAPPPVKFKLPPILSARPDLLLGAAVFGLWIKQVKKGKKE